MNIEQRKVSELVPDPQNARLHDQKNIDAIAYSLKTFGQLKPIVVTAENIVLAGNGTLTAAKQLGWKQIQVNVTPKDWSYEMARAYALADNKTADLASWDTSVLASQLLELDAEGWELGDLGFESMTPPTDPEIIEPRPPKTHACQACGEVIPCV